MSSITILQLLVVIACAVLVTVSILRRHEFPELIGECFMCKQRRVLGHCRWYAFTAHCSGCCRKADTDGTADWYAAPNPKYKRR